MQFDPDNPIVKLCAQGMDMEGQGKPEEAAALFLQAWQEATTDFERFTAAHYVARHQSSIADKLKWDETALQLASRLEAEAVRGVLPSLYLNIAKGHEDLHDPEQALTHYELALSYANALPEDGYGQMIKGGILRGIERVKASNSSAS